MRNPAVKGGAARNARFGLGKIKFSAPAAPPQAPPADSLSDLRFQRAVSQLHALGPRAVGELLAEVVEFYQCQRWLDSRLAVYGRLDPGIVRALHGDRFPPRPLHLIAPCSPAS